MKRVVPHLQSVQVRFGGELDGGHEEAGAVLPAATDGEAQAAAPAAPGAAAWPTGQTDGAHAHGYAVHGLHAAAGGGGRHARGHGGLQRTLRARHQGTIRAPSCNREDSSVRHQGTNMQQRCQEQSHPQLEI